MRAQPAQEHRGAGLVPVELQGGDHCGRQHRARSVDHDPRILGQQGQPVGPVGRLCGLGPGLPSRVLGVACPGSAVGRVDGHIAPGRISGRGEGAQRWDEGVDAGGLRGLGQGGVEQGLDRRPVRAGQQLEFDAVVGQRLGVAEVALADGFRAEPWEHNRHTPSL
jgi:hypothetical protein